MYNSYVTLHICLIKEAELNKVVGLLRGDGVSQSVLMWMMIDEGGGGGRKPMALDEGLHITYFFPPPPRQSRGYIFIDYIAS